MKVVTSIKVGANALPFQLYSLTKGFYSFKIIGGASSNIISYAAVEHVHLRTTGSRDFTYSSDRIIRISTDGHSDIWNTIILIILFILTYITLFLCVTSNRYVNKTTILSATCRKSINISWKQLSFQNYRNWIKIFKATQIANMRPIVNLADLIRWSMCKIKLMS